MHSHTDLEGDFVDLIQLWSAHTFENLSVSTYGGPKIELYLYSYHIPAQFVQYLYRICTERWTGEGRLISWLTPFFCPLVITQHTLHGGPIYWYNMVLQIHIYCIV